MNPPPNPLRSTAIFEALSLLTPWDTKTMRKIRVGAKQDGGYVMFDDFDNISAVYSFGIGTQITFDSELANMGKRVHMFDHTITGLPYEHENFDFVPQGLGATDDEVNKLFTLTYQIHRLGHSHRQDLALKIDVEGAEFEAVAATPIPILRQFRQFVLEIHWLSHLSDPGYRQSFINMLENINKVFTLCHVHGNNCSHVSIVDGYPIADVLELTYVRSDLIRAEASQTIYPTWLDYANAHWASDILLWFFPFLPSSTGGTAKDVKAAFAESLVYSDQGLRSYRARFLEDKLAALRHDVDSLERELAALGT